MKLNEFAIIKLRTAAAFGVSVAVLLLLFGVPNKASATNFLQECMALSTENNDIQNCLDNFLDALDDNIDDISAYISGDIGGATLEAFQRSQRAFFVYRKENCLWYLEFSPAGDRGEQLAKNCLANMSAQRLEELQSLIALPGNNVKQVRGYYVFGADRNSFQPCGNSDRFWVEGDSSVVGQLQQTYLSQATQELQLTYVTLAGQLTSSKDHAGHAGIATISAVIDVRLPNESDCGLPGNNLALGGNTSGPSVAVQPSISADIDANELNSEPLLSINEPEQVLRAYFGDWFAECKQEQSDFACDVSVAFTGAGVDANDPPTINLLRRANKRTVVQLAFPEREVDSTVKMRWRIDSYTFGDVVGSDILVDENGTRQVIRERKFVSEELMPLLIEGGELGIEILEDVDDESGEAFAATLNGLTRALAFADDFVSNEGSL